MDVECPGGIRLYAVPIRANDEIIGSINFGYGDPPQNRRRIEEIAGKYKVDPDDLQREANRYESRPKFIADIAKKRLQSSAGLIGALVESKTAQTSLNNTMTTSGTKLFNYFSLYTLIGPMYSFVNPLSKN